MPTARPQKPAAMNMDALRESVRAWHLRDESECVRDLLSTESVSRDSRRAALRQGRELVTKCRKNRHRAGLLDSFLQEFGLSNKEGVALMCLAESLLRVPDAPTMDRLISEKIASGDWSAHRGQSPSLFVNASVWGLMLTGSVVRPESLAEDNPDTWMHSLISRAGEPVIRQAMLRALQIMGGQYVLGRTIAEGQERAAGLAESCMSYDMLGEGARTFAAADAYFDSYKQAIIAIGEHSGGEQNPKCASGISVKLSALHPCYHATRREQIMDEMLPRLMELAMLAKKYNFGMSIDAEESERLDLSLEVLDALSGAPQLGGWDGLGFVLQAYQKRALPLCAWLAALARRDRRQLMVRLVKGAYWDAEIKRAQELGLDDYPVFTRKLNTDLSYQHCAAALLDAGRHIYPQFATHNAHTLAFVLQLTAERGHADFELQRLHGMGELLYAQMRKSIKRPPPVRVYAPIGEHRDLLPYLVRRLLENGANSSFVNRFLDDAMPVNKLVQDSRAWIERSGLLRHPLIPLPRQMLHGPGVPHPEPGTRQTARGWDLDDPLHAARLAAAAADCAATARTAGPIINGEEHTEGAQEVHSPAHKGRATGSVAQASAAQARRAMDAAHAAWPEWDARPAAERAAILERAADALEQRTMEFIGLIVNEGGRTLVDAVSEVREAVDFCRYYAAGARRLMAAPLELPGATGESNQLSLHGRGVFLCISPWNFPLAIFTGQVVAALATGNAVLAKPAGQTPLVAAAMVRLLHSCGVPAAALHFLPGSGRMLGEALLGDARLAGVAFTGSTDTAQQINRSLAARGGNSSIATLIAETGGVNAMIVDSTALPEQVVDDVLSSAFHSAGQRCSALRILCVQDDIADGLVEMLCGALDTLHIGDPALPASDLGPVIDAPSAKMLRTYCNRQRRAGALIAQCQLPPACRKGHYVAPCIVELESLAHLPGEVFGPVLHLVRYDASQPDALFAAINNTGFGLTLGVHSRLEGFARQVFAATRVGNTYINRNMIGAAVGINPFGGCGLSGTGPKAGGPHYLLRFCTERTLTNNTTAVGGNIELFAISSEMRSGGAAEDGKADRADG